MSYDYRVLHLFDRLDWRAKYRFGLYHYGCWRYLRIGKLGIQLWEIK